MSAGPEAAAAEAPARSGVRRVFQLLALTLVAALLVLLTWKLITQESGENFISRIKAGERPPAPAFTLPVIWDSTDSWSVELHSALDDDRVSLDELRGYPVVINFWASWCDPCKEEAPLLSAAARKHAGEVVFLGLDVQDFTSDARRFLERYGANNYVSVRDASNKVYEAYGLTGVPETFYLDAEGRAITHTLGQLSEQDLAKGIAAITEGSG